MSKKTKTEIELPESDKLMTIFTRSGNIQLRGKREDIRNFKAQIKHKDNRHKFLEVPPRIFAYNAALEEISVLPADVGVIIITDHALAAAQQNRTILQPVGPVKIKPN